MTPAATRAWLMMQPKPHALRITCEGDVSLLEVGNTAWVALGKTIAAKSPDLIEALDEKGVLIRAVRPAEEEDDTRSSSSSSASVTRDPETIRFELFAKLLAEAYKHANEVAFGKMVELFVVSNKRAENLEKSLASTDRILRKQFEEALEREPSEGSVLEQMVAQFAAGAGQKTQTNGAPKPNGKA
jgi:hypothetical protein